MNINLENRVYKIDDKVYKGHTQIYVQNQRGRLFIKYRGKQVNIKDIPILPADDNDYVYNYVFGNGCEMYSCPAMDYWIYRHRMGNKISVSDYKQKFKIIFNYKNKST